MAAQGGNQAERSWTSPGIDAVVQRERDHVVHFIDDGTHAHERQSTRACDSSDGGAFHVYSEGGMVMMRRGLRRCGQQGRLHAEQ